MRVILQEKVANLGNIGDVVNVKPGYGRNFLIPQGKAMRATDESIKEFEQCRAELEKKEAEKLAELKKRAEAIENKTIKLVAKASDEGKLFGSIGAREIAEAGEAAGIELHKNEVNLPEGPIRMTGEYDVNLALHSEVHLSIKVIVEAE